MEPAVLGIVLDSSAVIAAERNKLEVADFIDQIFRAHGSGELSLSSVTVAELVHGIFRARNPEASARRRAYVDELIAIPVHPITTRTGWLAGEIEGREAAKAHVLPFDDLLIAAAAIEQGYAVLTHNTRHFSKIPRLAILTI